MGAEIQLGEGPMNLPVEVQRRLDRRWSARFGIPQQAEQSIINARTVADFTRVVEQTGILVERGNPTPERASWRSEGPTRRLSVRTPSTVPRGLGSSSDMIAVRDRVIREFRRAVAGGAVKVDAVLGFENRKALGNAIRFHFYIDRGRQSLSQPNDCDERDDEENCAQDSRSVVRGCGMFLRGRSLDRQKIVAVAYRLDEDECKIQHQRNKAGEDELRLVVQRTEFLGREVRKNHRETGQRNEDRQSGARSLSLKSLLAVADAAHQQTGTDDAVAYDHNGRENHVSGQSGFRRALRS
jgi:hypothetical protein